MSGASRAGFTIIESMLFLAISGLMIVGVIAGAGVSINVNRYKDSTTSLDAYLQGQYDKAINVQNDRNNQLGCVGGVITDGSNQAQAQARGTSTCTVIGRFISVTNGGTTLESQPVYAGTDGSTYSDDLTALAKSSLFLSNGAESPESYTLEWGTKLLKPKSSEVLQSMKLLIVRSPSSGAIRTFVATDGTADSPAALLADAYRQDVLFCVDQSGLAAVPRRGSLIVKDAINSSGVKAASEGSC